MKILCTRDNLLNGVQMVQRAVPSKNALPILSGILLKAQNNRLHFTGTDLEMGIFCSTPVQVIEEGSAVLQARIFADLVRHLPDTAIEMELIPGTKTVSIRYNPSETSINGMDPEEFPVIPELDDNLTVTLRTQVFRSMVKQTAFAASMDENRPIFTGVLLAIDNRQLKMVATDTHRLAYKTGVIESSFDSAWQAIVPAKALVEVSRLIKEEDESITLVLTDNQVLFRFGDTSVISRLIEGQFPNYKQVIPSSCKTKIRLGTKAFTEAVERAALLAREGSNIIKIKAQDSALVITSNSPDLGKSYEEIDIEIQGEETQIAFNSRYLIDVLKVIDTEEILIELTGSLSPGIIRPMEAENYLYLILPVRTN